MRIIYFTICAIINLVCLLFSIYMRKFTNGTQNKIFLVLAWTVLISSILDFLCSFLQIYVTPTDFSNTLLMIFTECYFVVRIFSAMLFCVFSLFITSSFFRRKITLKMRFLFFIPAIIDLVALFVNPIVPILFKFENGLYKRLDYIVINYISNVFYMILGLFVVIKYRKILSNAKKIAMCGLYVIIAFSVVLQLLNENMLVEMFFTSVGLFVVMILIQRPDEYTDASIGAENFYGFSNLVNIIFSEKIPASVIIIKNLNDSKISSILDYKNYTKCQNYLSKILYSIINHYKGFCDLFYIGRGRFSLILRGESRFYSREMAEEILFEIQNLSVPNIMNFEMKFAICHVNLTNDEENSVIKSVNSLFNLSEIFQDFSWDHNEVLFLDKVKNKQLFGPYIEIEEIIKNAITNDGFEVYYQPIYSTTDDKVNSAEALIRLKDKKYNYISPEIFIPAAEKNGMIIQIGDFVLDSVCKFIASENFKQVGLEYIEVNLSVYQCMEPDLVYKVQNCVNKYGISPKQLNFEITESASEQGAIILKNIAKLSELGFHFSLDDYGTGYSNIRRIITLPLNIIKFDKTFVREAKNPQMKIVIKNSIDMIKEMNKKIVVEGIETSEMLETFSDLSVDFIQGYYFSKPLPENEFCNWLNTFKQQSC